MPRSILSLRTQRQDDRPLFHPVPDHCVAPHMEVGTEILGVGKANLPMVAGASVPAFHRHKQTIGFSDSKFDVLDKSLCGRQCAPFRRGLLPVSACRPPHIGQGQHLVPVADHDAGIFELQPRKTPRNPVAAIGGRNWPRFLRVPDDLKLARRRSKSTERW